MTPRSLVGMTMGARKRAVQCWMECERLHQKCQDLLESIDRAARRAPRPRTIGHTPARLKEHYRIGQRLRPCPGCQECGVRRFTKPEGFFSDNTHYVEIRDNAKVRLWRLKHTPILWQSKCGPRSVPTTFYDLEYCVGMVERFEWIELTQPNLCDGSGVLPARAKKVRR